MRTTITLDSDVLDEARAIAKAKHAPFKTVINEALRAGLGKVKEPAPRHAYKTRPHKMGLRSGYSLDNIQELLAQAEAEDAR